MQQQDQQQVTLQGGDIVKVRGYMWPLVYSSTYMSENEVVCVASDGTLFKPQFVSSINGKHVMPMTCQNTSITKSQVY